MVRSISRRSLSLMSSSDSRANWPASRNAETRLARRLGVEIDLAGEVANRRWSGCGRTPTSSPVAKARTVKRLALASIDVVERVVAVGCLHTR